MDFLNKDTAGLPNWAWLLVIGAGIVAAYLVPKFLGAKGAASSDAQTTGDTSGLGLAVDPSSGLPYAVEGLVPAGAYAGLGGQLPPLPAPTPPATPTTPGTIYTIPGAPGWQNVGAGAGVPLVPYAQHVPGVTGTIFNYLGKDYTIVAGPENRIWGVPGRMSAQQAINTPTKVLLHAPANYYTPATNQSMYTSRPSWPYATLELADVAARYGISSERLQQLNPDFYSEQQKGNIVRIA